MEPKQVRIAVVQAAPQLFDKNGALAKIAEWTQAAALQGAQLIVFPEAFVPGYPRGLAFGTRVGSRSGAGRLDWQRYADNALTIPGPELAQMAAMAKEAQAYLVVGVIEREGEHGGTTLYNSLVYIGPDGAYLGKHRKLMPTGAERLLWGQGDGSTLTVIDTPFGKVGGLICWENYMPLARMAMYAKGVDILLTPTADARDTWQSTLRHIACEGRCYVVSSNQYVTKASYPPDLACYADIGGDDDVLCRGGSAVVNPLGAYAIEPLYGSEGLLLADLDLSLVTQSRYDLDVVGHYSRPDVFQLIVNEQPQVGVQFR